MTSAHPLSQQLPEQSEASQLSLFEPEEIVRPEYNIGKWAGVIFVSPHARNVSEIRKFAFRTDFNGNKADAEIIITPMMGQSTPTTTTLKVYLALIQLWNQQGQSENGIVHFSARQLAAVAGWSWSGVIAKRIDQHIQILAGTTIDWILAFRTEEGTEKRVSKMSVVDEISYIERKISFGSERFTQNHWVRFNPGLVANMRKNLIRPINFKELVAIRSENSSNLYVLLDVFLTRKQVWERNAYDLIYRDLGYTGKRYETRFARKQRLEEFKKDLDGRDLVRGKLSIAIYENAAGTDWKLVARKILPEISARTGGKRIVSQVEAEAIAEELVDQIKRQSNSGTPRQGYLAWLALYVPKGILFEALSVAKADYSPTNTRKSLTHLFVAITKQIAEKQGIKIPERKK